MEPHTDFHGNPLEKRIAIISGNIPANNLHTFCQGIAKLRNKTLKKPNICTIINNKQMFGVSIIDLVR